MIFSAAVDDAVLGTVEVVVEDCTRAAEFGVVSEVATAVGEAALAAGIFAPFHRVEHDR